MSSLVSVKVHTNFNRTFLTESNAVVPSDSLADVPATAIAQDYSSEGVGVLIGLFVRRVRGEPPFHDTQP